MLLVILLPLLRFLQLVLDSLLLLFIVSLPFVTLSLLFSQPSCFFHQATILVAAQVSLPLIDLSSQAVSYLFSSPRHTPSL